MTPGTKVAIGRRHPFAGFVGFQPEVAGRMPNEAAERRDVGGGDDRRAWLARLAVDRDRRRRLDPPRAV